jgi:hypothetical protein
LPEGEIPERQLKAKQPVSRKVAEGAEEDL